MSRRSIAALAGLALLVASGCTIFTQSVLSAPVVPGAEETLGAPGIVFERPEATVALELVNSHTTLEILSFWVLPPVLPAPNATTRSWPRCGRASGA